MCTGDHPLRRSRIPAAATFTSSCLTRISVVWMRVQPVCGRPTGRARTLTGGARRVGATDDMGARVAAVAGPASPVSSLPASPLPRHARRRPGLRRVSPRRNHPRPATGPRRRRRALSRSSPASGVVASPSGKVHPRGTE